MKSRREIMVGWEIVETREFLIVENVHVRKLYAKVGESVQQGLVCIDNSK